MFKYNAGVWSIWGFTKPNDDGTESMFTEEFPANYALMQDSQVLGTWALCCQLPGEYVWNLTGMTFEEMDPGHLEFVYDIGMLLRNSPNQFMDMVLDMAGVILETTSLEASYSEYQPRSGYTPCSNALIQIKALQKVS